MSEKPKEVIVCKFDNEIECSEYNCEYTCSEMDALELDGEESCPLFKKEQLALLKTDELQDKIAEANKILDEYQSKFPYAATTTIELVGKLRSAFNSSKGMHPTEDEK